MTFGIITRTSFEETASKLGEALKVEVFLTENVPRTYKLINWGRKIENEEIKRQIICNKNVISSKLKKKLLMIKAGVRTPKCSSKLPAIIKPGNRIIYRYEKLLLENSYIEEFIEAKLEYRIHVFRNSFHYAFHVDEKKGGDGLIRNLENGWIFQEISEFNDLVIQVINESIKAVRALDYDFGAVDVLVSKDDQIYILEVNSAPGIKRRKLIEKYVRNFQPLLR